MYLKYLKHLRNIACCLAAVQCRATRVAVFVDCFWSFRSARRAKLITSRDSEQCEARVGIDVVFTIPVG